MLSSVDDAILLNLFAIFSTDMCIDRNRNNVYKKTSQKEVSDGFQICLFINLIKMNTDQLYPVHKKLSFPLRISSVNVLKKY